MQVGIEEALLSASIPPDITPESLLIDIPCATTPDKVLGKDTIEELIAVDTVVAVAVEALCCSSVRAGNRAELESSAHQAPHLLHKHN